MLLNARTIAVSTAVICFFGLSFIGLFSGLSPFTCWKRALAGAVILYIVTIYAVKAINTILISAMTTQQMNKRKEKAGGDRDTKNS